MAESLLAAACFQAATEGRQARSLVMKRSGIEENSQHPVSLQRYSLTIWHQNLVEFLNSNELDTSRDDNGEGTGYLVFHWTLVEKYK